ncbi:hypothetical protein WI99_27425 [Burkholderia cepacia]|nr:hypothetical protein WI99_27425 [Burkholderia cepacia]
MSDARRISEAVGSWLHLEFCCRRAGALSENSLKAVVNDVLGTLPQKTPGARVHADYPLAAINQNYQKGKYRNVDFALALKPNAKAKLYKDADMVVETKWASSSHCTPENIALDFLRLAIIKRNLPDCTCLFVLAGKASDVQAVLATPPFRGAGFKHGIGKKTTPVKAKLNHKSFEDREHFGPAINELSGHEIPRSFVATATNVHPYQITENAFDFQAKAWEVTEADANDLDNVQWWVPKKNKKK